MASSLLAGALLARRYRLIDRIGAGGMSVIWRARDEVLDRLVAVKVLAASLAADARFRDMVREEARAAAQLVHPHVATVHDYAETVAPDGTVTAFVVMELLAGEELETRLREGPLPWRQAVEVCAEVAEALAAAHRLDIVHRDVTPANIMLTPNGAKVLDFGIATHIGAPDDDTDGETFGTPAYVAPERLDGTPAQPATDTYALGVLLHETVTGQVPVPAETWDDLTRALRNPAAPAAPVVPGMPAAVGELCVRCLARDPRRRPTAHQAAVELRRALVPAPVGRRWPAVAVLAAAAAVAALALVLSLPSGDGQVSPPAAAPSPSPVAVPQAPVPTRSAAPVPGPVLGTAAALGTVRQVIDDGVASGAIRRDAGVDLRNLVGREPAEKLRAKVAVRRDEGAISDGYAARLDALLAQLGDG
jgi:serine/threonine-protein kinase